MLTKQLHEGLLINGVPFTDMQQVPTVKHEKDFCPVCPDGVCTWVILTREWYAQRTARRMQQVQEYKAMKAEYRDPAHMMARIGSYFTNADPMPTKIFGLKTKVRKGINAADAARQAQQVQARIDENRRSPKQLKALWSSRKVQAPTFSPVVLTGDVDLSEEESFEVKDAPLGDAFSRLITAIRGGKRNITPAQAKRLRKKANKGKAKKEATPKSSKARKHTILKVLKALVCTTTHEDTRNTKLFTSRFNKAQKSFNIITTNSSQEDIGFMRDGCWIGGSWDSFMGEFWVVGEA